MSTQVRGKAEIFQGQAGRSLGKTGGLFILKAAGPFTWKGRRAVHLKGSRAVHLEGQAGAGCSRTL